MEKPKDIKIVFGGQTGADRAGLDWAIKNGIVAQIISLDWLFRRTGADHQPTRN
jgi:hypothetical protein